MFCVLLPFCFANQSIHCNYVLKGGWGYQPRKTLSWSHSVKPCYYCFPAIVHRCWQLQCTARSAYLEWQLYETIRQFACNAGSRHHSGCVRTCKCTCGRYPSCASKADCALWKEADCRLKRWWFFISRYQWCQKHRPAFWCQWNVDQH